MAGKKLIPFPKHAIINQHPHFALARGLSRLPPSQNPVMNPDAIHNHPPATQAAIKAVADHPELRMIATNGVNPPMNSSPTGGAGGSFAQADANQSLAPTQNQFRRLPNVRHNVCGFAANVFAGAGTQTSTATPQVRFKSNRLVIPSNTLAGTSISNMLVGAKPQYAASSSEPADFFEETSTAALWDMDVCEIGQKVTMSVTVTGATTVYAALVGEALDGKPYPMLRSPLKRIAGIQSVALGATANVLITPQVRFKGRKLVIDDATATKFVINSIQVGINPQLMSGDPVPAVAFTETAQDLWLDLDEAYIGNVISINVTNLDGAAAHNFGVALLGDVNPNDIAAFAGR